MEKVSMQKKTKTKAKKEKVVDNSTQVEQVQPMPKKRGRPKKEEKTVVTLHKVKILKRVYSLNTSSTTTVSGVKCDTKVFKGRDTKVALPIADKSTVAFFEDLVGTVFKHLVCSVKENKKMYNNETFLSRMLLLNNNEFINTSVVEENIDAFFVSLSACSTVMNNFVKYMLEEYTPLPGVNDEDIKNEVQHMNDIFIHNTFPELSFKDNDMSGGCISVRFPTGKFTAENDVVTGFTLGNKMTITLEYFKKFSSPKSKGFKHCYDNAITLSFNIEEGKDFLDYLKSELSPDVERFLMSTFKNAKVQHISMPTIMTASHREPDVPVQTLLPGTAYPLTKDFSHILSNYEKIEDEKNKQKEARKKEYKNIKVCEDINYKIDLPKAEKNVEDIGMDVVTMMYPREAFESIEKDVVVYINGSRKSYEDYREFILSKSIAFATLSKDGIKKSIKESLDVLKKSSEEINNTKLTYEDCIEILEEFLDEKELAKLNTKQNNFSNLANVLLGDSEEETFQITVKKVKK